MVVTEAGRIVFPYAEEIFGLGREMMDTQKTGLPADPFARRSGGRCPAQTDRARPERTGRIGCWGNWP